MAVTWILVADSARARVFESTRRDEPLRQIESFANPDARESGQAFTTDHAPTVNESMGFARHSIEPHTTLRTKQATRFAKTLVAALEHGRTQQRFERLVVCAPAKFVGLLHGQCGKPLSDSIVAEIHRDLTALTATGIHERVVHLLEPSVPRSVLA